MSLVAHAPRCCESCGQSLPPQRKAAERLAEPFVHKPRKGGRQIALGPAVRAWTAYLEQEFHLPQRVAEIAASRVCLRALPAKQRRPRQR